MSMAVDSVFSHPVPVESVPKTEWLKGCGCEGPGPCNEIHDADLDELEALFPDDNEDRWRAFRYGLPLSSNDIMCTSLLTTRVGLSLEELRQLNDIITAYENSPVVYSGKMDVE